jgi:hypothetical protein
MLKRLKYISRSSSAMSQEEIAELAKTSVENNKQADITGVLVEASGIFFQVIEGPRDAVNALYKRISADPRHDEILLVNTMENCGERLFPQWAMKTVSLGAEDIRTAAIKLLLETAVEGHQRLQLLSSGIERFVWSEVSGNKTSVIEST